MDKEIIKKWVKKVGIAICSVIAIFLLYVVSVITYQEVYIPHHIESLYQEGLNNPSKAEWTVKQLQNIYDMDGVAQDKAIALIKEYAQKENLWAQIALEQYNENHKIPISSIIPINKNIWGIVLGKSTKEDVWSYLDSKGLWYLELENGSITQTQNDFEFIGIYWDYVNYHFTNNQVYKITFVSKMNHRSIRDYLEKLKGMLAEKYTLSKKFDYHWDDFILSDSNILIEVKSSYKELIFRYTDLKLKNKKMKQDTNNI